MQDKSKSTKRWKDHLLRSGVPLEYQVARVFSEHKFEVSSDFPFMRRDLSGTKEWSVDIDATWESKPDKEPYYTIHLLAECKYRSQDKCFVFFRDPNIRAAHGVLGGTVSSTADFCPFHLPFNSFVSLEKKCPLVYKGVELHEGSAVEEDLRRAIAQLRYAVPAHTLRNLEWAVDGAPSDAAAFFSARILVTNAPIRILNRGIDIDSIRAAETVDEVSTEAATVIMYSDYGPDYEQHFMDTFRQSKKALETRATRSEKWLTKKGFQISTLKDPVGLVSDLAAARRHQIIEISTQFFVTTLDGLPDLLCDIRSACRQSVKNSTKAPPEFGG